MIPYLLAVVGGYLIGDSIGEDIDKKIPEFADGGVMAKGGQETLKNYQVIGTIVKEIGSEPPPEADREDYIDIEREEFTISVMASSEEEAERIAEEEMMDKHLLDEYGSSFTRKKQYYSGSVEIEDVIETGR
jgi:hypothetical protein